MARLEQRGKAKLGIEQPSGIAYHAAADELLVVSDEEERIFALDPRTAKVLREIELKDDDRDREGVAVRPTDPPQLLVAAERSRRVLCYGMDGTLLDDVGVPVTGSENAGLEGITVDVDTGRVFVVHEKDPRALLELDDALRLVAVHGMAELSDLSGLCFEADGLWVVSDESKKLARYELSERGLSLKRTWKLGHRRAEGIAVAGDLIYVLFDRAGTNLRWYERPEP
jgi:uncharacterized protein YjiK